MGCCTASGIKTEARRFIQCDVLLYGDTIRFGAQSRASLTFVDLALLSHDLSPASSFVSLSEIDGNGNTTLIGVEQIYCSLLFLNTLETCRVDTFGQ